MLLTPPPAQLTLPEVERRHRLRHAQVRDELSQAEYQHDLDLHDRAEKDGVAWATRVPHRLTFHEHPVGSAESEPPATNA